jgi:hypothetical protein
MNQSKIRSELVKVLMSIVESPQSDILEGTVDLSRMPVLGEYIQRGNDWFEVKRVIHAGDQHAPAAGQVYVIPIVDPTDNRLTISEWLEPGTAGK